MKDPVTSDEFAASSPPTPPLPPAPPLSSEAGSEYRKSPALAAFLAIVPGLGHLYVGTYQRAVMLVVTFFATIWLFPVPIDVFLCLFIWFFGLFDAYRMAQIAALGEEPSLPRATPQSGLAFGVFLTVVGVLLLLRTRFDIRFEWLQEWWPAIPVVAGLYLIIASILERSKRAGADRDEPTLPAEEDYR